LVKEQQKLDGNFKLKAPLRFSETRFATYSEQLKKNFVDNYPAFFNTLQETRDDKLDKRNNAELILQASSSIDTYKAIGEVSRKVQDPALFRWQVDKAVDDGVADLRNIACQLRQEVDNVGLDNQPAVGGKSKTKFFKSAKSEILKDGTFKDDHYLDMSKYLEHPVPNPDNQRLR
jgi:hypothetical protein